MLREPTRHDGISTNQTARDRQRELQRQERAQMLPSDDAELSSTTQDLFYAPVKVKPSIEDPTTIEIRKTFGNYENARPYLMDSRRLIGVDLNSTGSNQSQNSSIDPTQNRTQSNSNTNNNFGSTSTKKFFNSNSNTLSSSSNSLSSSHRTSFNSNNTTLKGVNDGISNCSPVIQTGQSSSNLLTPNTKSSLVNIHHQANSTYTNTGQYQTPTLTEVQNSMRNTLPRLSPLPEPVRKQNKLSTTTLPITFATSFPTNTLSGNNICMGGNRDIKPNITNLTIASSNLTKNSSLLSNTNNSATNSEVSNSSASVGASFIDRAYSSPFRKPHERIDSKVDVDSMIREMTNVASPLSEIPLSDSPSKKITPRRSSNNDETNASIISNVMKNNVSPLSATGLNSSSSSSGTDSSDSDTDSDSSSENDRASTSTPAKNPTSTTRSPNGRENWGLSSFVGGLRKENELIGNTSVPLESKSNLSTSPLDSYSERFLSPTKTELDVTSSTPVTGKSSNTHSSESSKVVSKSSQMLVKSFSPPSKAGKDNFLGLHSKSSIAPSKLIPEHKGKVPPVPSKPVSTITSAGAKINLKDPTLSATSSEDESPRPSLVAKEKNHTSPAKIRVLKKRSADTKIIEQEPIAKKPRKKVSQVISPPPPKSAEKPKTIEKPVEKVVEKLKSDRNKTNMIGRLFRPKKDKTDDGTKDRDSKSGSLTNAVAEAKSKSRSKSPTHSNRVSAKDSSGKKAQPLTSSGNSTSSISLTKTSEISHSEKIDSKNNHIKVKEKSASSKTSHRTKTTSGIEVNEPLSDRAKRSLSPKKTTTSSEIVKWKSTDRNPKHKIGSSLSPKANRSGTKLSGTKDKPQSKLELKGSQKLSVTPPKLNKSSKPNKSVSNGSKSASLAMPPPPPPSAHPSPSSSLKLQSIKKEKIQQKLPPSLMVSIPITALKRVPKNLKKDSQTKKQSYIKKGKENLKDVEKEENRVKSISTNTSLVGSSVEDVENQSLSIKSHRGGTKHSQTKKAKVSENVDGNHKRSKSKSHSSSKKQKVKKGSSFDGKVETEKRGSCDVSCTTTLYNSSTPAAKTPPDPPDSSLNPTHSSSPTVVAPHPQYLSYFEKVEHQEDYYAYDQSYYLNEAKRLKHRADKDESGLTQLLTYVDSTLYFVLAGILMERTVSPRDAFSMFKDTFNLIKYIGSRPRGGFRQEDSQDAKLQVLNLRIQSLLSLHLFKMKSKETMEMNQQITDVFSSANKKLPDYLGSLSRSPQTTLSTPSPHSPSLSLSPAGLTPLSVISSSSTQSPHHSPPNHVVTKQIYNLLQRHFNQSNHLIQSHDLWDQADSCVEKHHIQDFFIVIDRLNGPLTLHSSLLDLVRYVRSGLKILNQNLMDTS